MNNKLININLIKEYFDGLKKHVFISTEFKKILKEKHLEWNLSEDFKISKFINLLINEGKLTKYEFNFPVRKEIRYTWGLATVYEIAISLKPHAYFSHYSALFLHQLTEQIPNSIYVNAEQKLASSGTKDLPQENIDRAFGNKPRTTNNIATYQKHKIFLLNGMNTNNLGVIEYNGPEGKNLYVTDIERTLIDIVVRPYYSGGIFEILEAYKNASTILSITKLIEYIKELNYTYPYHQAIGYYMQKSGTYSEDQISFIKEEFKIRNNFYLTYNMKEKVFINDWKLFIPKGF